MRLAKDLSSLQFGVVLDTALDAVIVMRTDGLSPRVRIRRKPIEARWWSAR